MLCVWQIQIMTLAVRAEVSPVIAKTGQIPPGDGRENVQIRKPDEQFLEKYRNDPDFDYFSEVPKGISWWERFVWWLSKHLGGPVNVGPAAWMEVVLKVIAMGVVLFLIYKLVRSRYRSPFVRRLSGKSVEEMLEGGEMDEKAWLWQLEKAVAEKNYVLAIRIHYCYILRLLDAKEIIRWSTYRSNLSYYYEIKEEGLRKKFGELIRIFNCVCYGEFRVDAVLYGQLAREFEDFQEEVEK